ncbi:MAG: chloride channel protein [Bacteroidetes bacterium]|nr:chloride channel protein [Bacteroidota bacterium]
MQRILRNTIILLRDLRDKLELYFHRFRGTEHTFMVIVAVIIGLLGGFGAVAIQWLIKLFQKLFWGDWDLTLQYFESVPDYWKIAVPVIGSAIVGLVVYYFSREAKGHGVPEVMEAIALRDGKIRPRVVLAKLFASSVYIGAGGSVGREGPVIQIGSSIGSAIGQLLRVNPRRTKTFVACGAASGIAAAFNAPVAGALFSVEIILGDFGVAQFSPIVISSVVATVVSRHFLGDFPAFIIPKYHLVSPLELIPYAFLGVLAGAVALLFTKTLYKLEDFFDDMKLNGVLKTMIGGLLLGCMGVFVPYIFGVGYDTMNFALLGQLSWLTMLLLIFAKIFATSLSLGSGGSGGVFAPSLFLGTMTGGFFGALVHMLMPEYSASSGAYSLVGMGAVVAGATHAPITAILIIFEMTNDYKIILPLMISSIIATVFSIKMQKESIYTLKLIRKGIDLFGGRDINLLRQHTVRSIIRRDQNIILNTTSLPSLLKTMLAGKHEEYFVVNSEGALQGIVNLQMAKEFIEDQDIPPELILASDLMRTEMQCLQPDDNLDLVMHHFGRIDSRQLPVVENEQTRKLLGRVRAKDVIDMYNKEIFKKDLVGGMHSIVSGMERDRTIDVFDTHQIVETTIPGQFVGQSIIELDIRNRYGVEVILVRKKSDEGVDPSSRPGTLPTGQYRFEEGDDVLLIGEKDNIERFRHNNPLI